MQKNKKLACKKIDKTKIGGRWSCGVIIFESIDNTNGRREGERHWSENTTIHRSVSGGKRKMKGDGDRKAWVGNYRMDKVVD